MRIDWPRSGQTIANFLSGYCPNDVSNLVPKTPISMARVRVLRKAYKRHSACLYLLHLYSLLCTVKACHRSTAVRMVGMPINYRYICRLGAVEEAKCGKTQLPLGSPIRLTYMGGSFHSGSLVKNLIGGVISLLSGLR